MGENLSEFDDLSSFMSSMSGIDSTTGNAILAADNGVISGEMVNDDDIQIEGIDPGSSLADIAESLNLDSSLVTSNAMAETLSSVANEVSNDVGPVDPDAGSAMDCTIEDLPIPGAPHIMREF